MRNKSSRSDLEIFSDEIWIHDSTTSQDCDDLLLLPCQCEITSSKQQFSLFIKPTGAVLNYVEELIAISNFSLCPDKFRRLDKIPNILSKQKYFCIFHLLHIFSASDLGSSVLFRQEKEKKTWITNFLLNKAGRNFNTSRILWFEVWKSFNAKFNLRHPPEFFYFSTRSVDLRHRDFPALSLIQHAQLSSHDATMNEKSKIYIHTHVIFHSKRAENFSHHSKRISSRERQPSFHSNFI